MRSLGHNPSVEELEVRIHSNKLTILIDGTFYPSCRSDLTFYVFYVTKYMMREIPPSEATGEEARVDFPEFLTIMARRGPSTIHEGKKEIIEAFHVFDKEDTGVVSAPDLLKALTKFGFKLEEHEVEEMFRISKCVDNNGQIKYKQLVEQYF